MRTFEELLPLESRMVFRLFIAGTLSQEDVCWELWKDKISVMSDLGIDWIVWADDLQFLKGKEGFLKLTNYALLEIKRVSITK